MRVRWGASRRRRRRRCLGFRQIEQAVRAHRRLDAEGHRRALVDRRVRRLPPHRRRRGRRARAHCDAAAPAARVLQPRAGPLQHHRQAHIPRPPRALVAAAAPPRRAASVVSGGRPAGRVAAPATAPAAAAGLMQAMQPQLHPPGGHRLKPILVERRRRPRPSARIAPGAAERRRRRPRGRARGGGGRLLGGVAGFRQLQGASDEERLLLVAAAACLAGGAWEAAAGGAGRKCRPSGRRRAPCACRAVCPAQALTILNPHPLRPPKGHAPRGFQVCTTWEAQPGAAPSCTQP
jgi:hypothetical protein